MRNPLMSFWLSAANRMFATSRAYANVEMKRQARRAQTSLTKAATPSVIPAIETMVLKEMVRLRRFARRYRNPMKIS